VDEGRDFESTLLARNHIHDEWQPTSIECVESSIANIHSLCHSGPDRIGVMEPLSIWG
jgi:hypothetical protein